MRFNRLLKVSTVLYSLIAVGNSFQMVGAEKVKERLLKLVVCIRSYFYNEMGYINLRFTYLLTKGRILTR